MSFCLSPRLALIPATALLMGAVVVPVSASTGTEEQQGAALVREHNTKNRACKSFSSAEFERMGEYAMGLGFASVAQHTSMNEHMRAMTGPQGERQAHQTIGRAYSGCATSESTGAYGTMMGTRGSTGAGVFGPEMMGGIAQSQARTTAGSAQGTSTVTVVVIAVLAAALAASLTLLARPRMGRGRLASHTT